MLQRLPSWLKLGALIAAAIVALAVALLAKGGSERLVLTPATVPPVVDECSQQLVQGADGNIRPVSCPDGKLNQLAWQYLAGKVDPLTFALGPNATPEQVNSALCSDLDRSTLPIIATIYEIAQLYYGWQFGIDPVPSPAGGGSPC